MKYFQILGVSLLMVFLASCATSLQSKNEFLWARYSSGGPGGFHWEITLSNDGWAKIYVLDAGAKSSGKIKGKIFIYTLERQSLKTLVDEVDFFNLPERITRPLVYLHQPDLRLTVTVGKKTKTVNLYELDEIKDTPQAKRFLKLWNAIFRYIPEIPIYTTSGA